MKKHIVTFLLVFTLLNLIHPLTASADMGPKPSVVVDFAGLDGQTYYVTLLSLDESTGPYSSFEFHKRNSPFEMNVMYWYNLYYQSDEDYPVFLQFAEYDDPDGYYFLGFIENCSQTHQFTWGYHPPQSFKILICFPDSETFAVSGEILERYAFASYFLADLTEVTSSASEPGYTYFNTIYFNVEKKYDYSGEIFALIARIILTVAIELLIALMFALRHKKQLLFILVVNLITQIALNVTLNIVDFVYGYLALLFLYILLELIIVIIETAVYSFALKRYSSEPLPKWKPAVYAFVANAASFIIGLLLVNVLPGIF